MKVLTLLLLVTGGALLKASTAESGMAEEENKTTVNTVTLIRDDDGEVPVVMTSTGKVSGIREKSTEGKSFLSYYSIPYAKPPIGNLRFKNPEMLNGWGGVKDGSKLPPQCPQLSMLSSLGGGQEMMVGDEDCLYLNIFTPKAKDQRPHLPVMVFIHGGGFTVGSSQEYPPHALLNEDIVLVTIQYRLGVLGFLSTEDNVAPGNMGLRDQTMALSWIQRNIPKFGGDPLRVTLFGESAGAASVHFQVLSPKSIGLFKRAILQSGTALCPWAMGGRHSAMANYTGSVFNCTTTAGSEALISCLQKVDAHKLASVADHIKEIYNFPLLLGPRVDGQFLPAHPDFLMKEGRHKRVDLMSGVTQHDGAIFSVMTYANEAVRSSLIHNFRHKAPYTLEFREDDVAPLNQTVMIYDHYLHGLNIDADHADHLTQMFTDRHFAVCHDLTTQLHAASLAPHKNTTYRYELQYRGEHSFTNLFQLDIGKHWISHIDDLTYLFEGGVFFRPLTREEDFKMRKIMLKLWTNFAATGNPTPDDSLGFQWEPVKHGNLKYLSLTTSPTMKEDNRKETRDFWYSLPLKQNLFLHPERVPNLVYTPLTDTEEDNPEETTTKGTKEEEATPEETKEEIIKEETKPKTDTEKTKTQEEEATEDDGREKDEL